MQSSENNETEPLISSEENGATNIPVYSEAV